MARTIPMTIIKLPPGTQVRGLQLTAATGITLVSADDRPVPLHHLEISREEPTPQQVALLENDERLLTLPEMLLVPVEPVAVAEGGGVAGDPPSMSWGIAEIGADRHPAEAGKGVTVAILDSGIIANWKTHPAFAGKTIIEENFTTDPQGDALGHGSHCAGTILGQDVNGTRIGIARGVDRVLVGKVLGAGGGTTTVLNQALMWALSKGAHVISISLGVNFGGYRQSLVDNGFHDLEATSIALTAYRANLRVFDLFSRLATVPETGLGGAVVCAAAGNDSLRPEYTIAVAPPAVGENFISVGAVGRTLTVSSFSNRDVKFAAPGEDIWSIDKDGKLRAQSGTSMATPHVAGVAALWAQHSVTNGSFNASEVIELLKQNTRLLPGQSVKDVGSGLVQAP